MQTITTCINSRAQRNHWIDLCKTCGLLLVILGHGRLLPANIQQFIYSFHMPLFFILSGLLYKYKSPSQTIAKDIKRLLIPYLLINLVCLFLQCCLLFIQGNLTPTACFSRLVGILVVGCYSGNYPPVSVPTWFIITLFIIRMLLSLSKSKIYLIVLVIVSIFLFIIIKKENIDTWIPLDSALMSLPFVVLGIKLAPYMAKNRTRSHRVWGGVMVAILLLIILSNYNGLVDVAYSEYGNNIIIFYTNGILGSFILIYFSKVIPHYHKLNNFCVIISKGSLLVIGFNLYFVMLFQTTTEKCINGSINPIIGISLSFIILNIFYWLTRFCQRFMPIFIGMR